MGRWKALLPIILALVIALGGSVYIYQYITARTAPPTEIVKIETEACPVAVAALDLPAGTKIKKEFVTTAPYMKEGLPPQHFSDIESLVDRVTISPLRQNEPVLAFKLAPEDVKTGGVSAVVKKGKRAIAVKGDKVIGISGFILPGNKVDVLVTLKNPSTKQETTKTVLENVLVMATGTQIEETEGGKPAPVDVYTMEVTPDEAEILALAAAEGKLQFALRNATDDATVTTYGATTRDTLRSFRKYRASKSLSATRKSAPKSLPTITVEIIKDGKLIKKQMQL